MGMLVAHSPKFGAAGPCPRHEGHKPVVAAMLQIMCAAHTLCSFFHLYDSISNCIVCHTQWVDLLPCAAFAPWPPCFKQACQAGAGPNVLSCIHCATAVLLLQCHCLADGCCSVGVSSWQQLNNWPWDGSDTC